MVRIGIVGSTGRMGEHLIKNILENETLFIIFTLIDRRSVDNMKINQDLLWQEL